MVRHDLRVNSRFGAQVIDHKKTKTDLHFSNETLTQASSVLAAMNFGGSY
jgi:hypothetical protein